MFSVRSFTLKAKLSHLAQGLGSKLQLDAFSFKQRRVLLGSEALGSVKMRRKSSTVSDCNSTRMGKRPCNSG